MKAILTTAIGGFLAISLSSAANAADAKMEKCFGVAKAGMNDCSSSKSTHSCAGQAGKNNDSNDFVMLPKGSCNKIANGKLISSETKTM